MDQLHQHTQSTDTNRIIRLSTKPPQSYTLQCPASTRRCPRCGGDSSHEEDYSGMGGPTYFHCNN